MRVKSPAGLAGGGVPGAVAEKSKFGAGGGVGVENTGAGGGVGGAKAEGAGGGVAGANEDGIGLGAAGGSFSAPNICVKLPGEDGALETAGG